MFKRATAISLLVLANIVLLAIAVVPHHHHGEMMCFVASHCAHGHDCGHNAACGQHDHMQPVDNTGHEHPGDAHCCKVGEWLLPNVEAAQKHTLHCHCTSCDHNSGLFVAILPEFQQPTITPVYLSFRQAPTTETYLRTYVSQTLGLRAPPFNGIQTARI